VVDFIETGLSVQHNGAIGYACAHRMKDLKVLVEEGIDLFHCWLAKRWLGLESANIKLVDVQTGSCDSSGERSGTFHVRLCLESGESCCRQIQRYELTH
jgi:hypothetical protein